MLSRQKPESCLGLPLLHPPLILWGEALVCAGCGRPVGREGTPLVVLVHNWRQEPEVLAFNAFCPACRGDNPRADASVQKADARELQGLRLVPYGP